MACTALLAWERWFACRGTVVYKLHEAITTAAPIGIVMVTCMLSWARGIKIIK